MFEKLKSYFEPERESLSPAEQMRQEAKDILETLPIEIRDPVGRGEGPVAWTTIPKRPSSHDLMALSDEDFAKYRRLVELDHESQRLLEAELTQD